MKKKPCHELVMGMTGSGKTVFSRGALLPAYQEVYPTVIVDTKHDKNDELWNYADVTVNSVKAMIKYLEKGWHVHYRVKDNGWKSRWAQFDTICKAIARMEGGIVTYVNEGGDVMTNIKMPEWFEAMLRKGRSPQHFAIVETQRPSLIVHPNLFNNTESFWMFRLGQKDRDAIRKWFDDDGLDEVANMEKFSFLWTDGYESSVSPPIDLEVLEHGKRRNEEREPRPSDGIWDSIGVFGTQGAISDAVSKSRRRKGAGGRGAGSVQEVSVRIGDAPARDTRGAEGTSSGTRKA